MALREKGAYVVHIVDAPVELALLVEVVDANEQGFAPARAV